MRRGYLPFEFRELPLTMALQELGYTVIYRSPTEVEARNDKFYFAFRVLRGRTRVEWEGHPGIERADVWKELRKISEMCREAREILRKEFAAQRIYLKQILD